MLQRAGRQPARRVPHPPAGVAHLPLRALARADARRFDRRRRHRRRPGRRWLLDPRVVHSLTLEVDRFGNVLRFVDVAYGRRQRDLRIGSRTTGPCRRRIAVTYTENRVTGHDTGDAAIDGLTRTARRCPARRAPTSSPASTLRAGRHPVHVRRDRRGDGRGRRARLRGAARRRGGAEAPDRARPHLLPPRRPDRACSRSATSSRWRALRALHARVHARPGRRGLRRPRRADADARDEGGYVHTEGDAELVDPVRADVLLPDARRSAGGRARLRPPALLPAAPLPRPVPLGRGRAPRASSPTTPTTCSCEETRDAVGNRVTAGERTIDPTQPLVRRAHDYRVLQPTLVMDANRNRSAVAFDALGMVGRHRGHGQARGVAGPWRSPGPAFRADLTQRRDRPAPRRSDRARPRPRCSARPPPASSTTSTPTGASPDPAEQPAAVAATLARETHVERLCRRAAAPIQVTLSYSDGFGREIQKKIQAEPGPVPQRDPPGSDRRGPGRPAGADARRREPALGRQRLDRVQQQGPARPPVRTVLHRHPPLRVRRPHRRQPGAVYDPLGNASSPPCTPTTPGRRWSSTRGGRRPGTSTTPCWSPTRRRTPTSATSSAACPLADYLPTWHALRTDPAHDATAAIRWPDPPSREAERAAAAQDGGPRRDADRRPRRLARPHLPHVAHNRSSYSDTPPAIPRSRSSTARGVVLDIEGNQREVIDAIGRVVMRYDYDLLGNRIHQASMEAGERWMLDDVAGKPLYAWDSRGHRLRTAYDACGGRRHVPVREGAGRRSSRRAQRVRRLTRRTRTPRRANLRGKLVRAPRPGRRRHHDDVRLQGQPAAYASASSPRRTDTLLDWSAAVPLQAESFTSSTRYDALNRPIQVVAPHGRRARRSASIQPATTRPTCSSRSTPGSIRTPSPRAARAGDGDVHVGHRHRLRRQGPADQHRLRQPDGTVVRTTYRHDPETFRVTDVYTAAASIRSPARAPRSRTTATTRSRRHRPSPHRRSHPGAACGSRTCTTPTTRPATSPTSATTPSRPSSSATRASSRAPTTPTTPSTG